MRGTPEGLLVEDFCDRARKLGRNMGFSAVALEELAVSKQREAAARMKDEAERLAARLPAGAHIVLLDARGKGMTSEDFAEMLRSLRDVGTKDLAFMIGGPDGLASLPGKKAGRSLAFGPQTWPHLLARALLAEQVYRALTILAGHPYHRA
jgi:23S rRNA (pseudouridine1915-N3)-methyltransferase